MLWRHKKRKKDVWRSAEQDSGDALCDTLFPEENMAQDAQQAGEAGQTEGFLPMEAYPPMPPQNVYGEAAAQNLYAEVPQNPYGAVPSQNPYGEAPQNPYGAMPMQSPYGEAPQSLYGDMPLQSPYGEVPPLSPYPQAPMQSAWTQGQAFTPPQQAGNAYVPPAGTSVFAVPVLEEGETAQAGETPQTDAENADNVLELFPEEEQGGERKARAPLIKYFWACALGVLIVGTFVFCFFMFRVANIEVSGNESIPSQTIIQMAGVEYGAHMLTLARSAGIERLCKNPYIAKADIRRVYPDGVKISIVERREAAAIISLGAVAIIDADGYVLSISQRDSYPELLKIYGAGASGYQVNGHIGDIADYSSRALSALIEAVKQSGIQPMIESADISNALNVTMQTRSGVSVNLGQAEDLENKLRKLAIVLPEVEKMGYTDGTISVYSHGAPVYSPYVPPAEKVEEETDENEYTYVPSDTGSTPAPEDKTEEAQTSAPAEAPTPSPRAGISPGELRIKGTELSIYGISVARRAHMWYI